MPDEFEGLTIGDLKRAIEAAGLPDDAPVFADDGLNPIVRAAAKFLVHSVGSVIECRSEADQAKAVEQENARWPDSPAEAVTALMLTTEDRAEWDDIDELLADRLPEDE